MDRRIVVDAKRCTGCHSCEMACALEHSKAGDLAGMMLGGERPGYRLYVESCGTVSVPVVCRHCRVPACRLACPTGAIRRRSAQDPVVADNERCIGCGMCVQACPFGMISLTWEGRGVVKCDLCVDRLAQGKEPACVEGCPTKALVFGKQQQTSRARRQKTATRVR